MMLHFVAVPCTNLLADGQICLCIFTLTIQESGMTSNCGQVRAKMVEISLESLFWAFIPRIQRVLNNLQRPRFSRRRMIWLLPSPLDRRDTGRVRKRDNLLTGEGGRGRSLITRRRGSLALYKSFNTLCSCQLVAIPPTLIYYYMLQVS